LLSALHSSPVRQQLVDRLTCRVAAFGDLLGRGPSRAGGNDLAVIEMHVPSSREIRNLTSAVNLIQVSGWDFDTGRHHRVRSRAVVRKYRLQALQANVK